jgi:hypothetical protein
VTPDRARRLLGVEPGAARGEIERAFRRLARTAHPDRGGDPGEFATIVAARDRLLRPPPAAADQVIVVRSSRMRRAVRRVQRWRFRMRQPRPSARVR